MNAHRRRVRREQNRAEVLALCVLTTFEGRWLGALEVAEYLGDAWRPLAFALRRLVERGIVDEQVIQIPGSARSKEDRRIYRIRVHTAHPLFPPVPRPPPGVARLVRGRCSVRGRDQDVESNATHAERIG